MRHRGAVASAGAHAGMTLLEVLVALVLLGLLAVGMVTGFRFGERSYRQIFRMDGEERDIARAQVFLRGVVESAYPFSAAPDAIRSAAGLESDGDALEITAPMPNSQGNKGYYRYEIVLVSRQDGFRDLVVRHGLDRNGAASVAGDEVLLERVRGVEWSFLEEEPSNPAIEPIAANAPRWVDLWRNQAKPPRLVRLRVQFDRFDPRIWPELLVNPLVTDDARCDFDTVSQSCRGAQS